MAGQRRELCEIYAHLLCYAFFLGILIIFGAGVLMIADAIQPTGKLQLLATNANAILMLIGVIMVGFCVLMFIFAKYWKPLKFWLIKKMKQEAFS